MVACSQDKWKVSKNDVLCGTGSIIHVLCNIHLMMLLRLVELKQDAYVSHFHVIVCVLVQKGH